MSYDTAPKTFSVSAPTFNIHGVRVHIETAGRRALCNKSYQPGITGTWAARRQPGTEWMADIYTLCPRCQAKHVASQPAPEIPAEDRALDQAQRDVNRLYLSGEMTHLEYETAIEAIRSARTQEEPEAWPAGKTFGELTPAQRRAATRRAADQLSAELQAAAPEISRIMDEAEPPANAPGPKREITGVIRKDEVTVHATGCPDAVPFAVRGREPLPGIRATAVTMAADRGEAIRRVSESWAVDPGSRFTFAFCAGLPEASEELTPERATAETIAALGSQAAKFKVESTPNPHACQPLREATVRTLVRVAAPATGLDEVLPALRALPGLVQLSADRRDVILFRR